MWCRDRVRLAPAGLWRWRFHFSFFFINSFPSPINDRGRGKKHTRREKKLTDQIASEKALRYPCRHVDVLQQAPALPPPGFVGGGGKGSTLSTSGLPQPRQLIGSWPLIEPRLGRAKARGSCPSWGGVRPAVDLAMCVLQRGRTSGTSEEGGSRKA